MTYTCCPACRLRFEALASGNDRCPDCQGELEPALASQLIGYRLAGRGDLAEVALAVAVQAALTVPADDA